MVSASCTKLRLLRSLLKEHNVFAYTLRTGDCHNSEFVADRDKRIAYVSSFSGSNAVIVVTQESALLWTDGRYFEQAEKQLPSDWTLMKDSQPGVPTLCEWLAKLPTGSKIGFDPYLVTIKENDDFKRAALTVVPINRNLIDLLWDVDTNEVRPSYSQDKLFILQKSGLSCGEKLQLVRDKLKESSTLIVTALDEIAWILNLRGNDIPYTPVFFAFLAVTARDARLYVNKVKLNVEINEHLAQAGVKVKGYESFWSSVQELPGDVMVTSRNSSVAVENVLGPKCKVVLTTPVAQLKAIKNPVEQEGFRQCHIKDAVAVCEFLFELSRNVENYDELSAEALLDSLRAQQSGYISPSFRTISGYGRNGSIIHYNASNETNLPLGRSSLYLVDSGGQYDTGTTDITRTTHFGTPSDYERKCFTAVLKGHLALGDAKFPEDAAATRLDSIARMPLWDLGMDYAHGTGHGVGYCLNVHEGPFSISTRMQNVEPLYPGAIVSDEPGYYENGKFGIRIESLLLCKKSEKQSGYLCFEYLTLVPISTNLVDLQMLCDKEIGLLNRYHQQVRDALVRELRKQGKDEALVRWVIKETEPVSK